VLASFPHGLRILDLDGVGGPPGRLPRERHDAAGGQRAHGAVLSETALTPTSVPGHLERVYERRIDGQMLANPLYVEGVQVTPSTKKSLFFLATAKNCVYAFDLADHTPDSAPAVPADHCDTSTRAVWHREVGATAGVVICAETRPGAISLSADGDRNGIVWALIPNADAQVATVPGHLVAYRADLLTELWRDDDPMAFAKFNPPLAVAGHVIRPTFADRVIVYALGTGQAPLPCYSIDEKVQVLGSSSGTLGRPASEVIDLADAAGGKVRYFEGAEPVGGACGAPEEVELARMPTVVTWSEKSCAHVLRGAALALWESLGAEAGTLGYPLTDEIPTRDGAGRHIVFEHGEIRWTPTTDYTVSVR
jgi:LGFP repeat